MKNVNSRTVRLHPLLPPQTNNPPAPGESVRLSAPAVGAAISRPPVRSAQSEALSLPATVAAPARQSVSMASPERGGVAGVHAGDGGVLIRSKVPLPLSVPSGQLSPALRRGEPGASPRRHAPPPSRRREPSPDGSAAGSSPPSPAPGESVPPSCLPLSGKGVRPSTAPKLRPRAGETDDGGFSILFTGPNASKKRQKLRKIRSFCLLG